MNTSNILAALEIMGKGMEGIFVTILIIMVCVWLMGTSKIGNLHEIPGHVKMIRDFFIFG